MKKILALILLICLSITSYSTTCNHNHDEFCGYDTTTETNCAHEHNNECEYINPHYTYPPEGGHD